MENAERRRFWNNKNGKWINGRRTYSSKTIYLPYIKNGNISITETEFDQHGNKISMFETVQEVDEEIVTFKKKSGKGSYW